MRKFLKNTVRLTRAGGYPKLMSQGLNEQYLSVWLQKAGFNIYYTGKLCNSHTVDNYIAPCPASFTGLDFLLDPYTYEYLNSTWQRGRDAPVGHEGRYTTDIIIDKAKGFLNDALKAQKLFFLTIAPVAPYSNVEFNGNILIDLGSLLGITPPL